MGNIDDICICGIAWMGIPPTNMLLYKHKDV